MTKEELLEEVDQERKWLDEAGYTEYNVDMVFSSICKNIKALEPKTGYCKDCKWWKDSDGTYRRGVRAESKCPINTKTVFLGDGYCYKFEPKIESGE